MFGKIRIVLPAALLACASHTAASADTVTPQMGGGRVGMMDGAAMKHTDIGISGNTIVLHIDETVGTPVLRPLDLGDTFLDAGTSHPHDVLEGSAYNYQWAWNPDGSILSGNFDMPEGGAFWIERVAHTDGLVAYLRTPQYNPGLHGAYWPEVFANDGDRLKWAGSMLHNAYAVTDPALDKYSATYLVYLGDAETGDPIDGYVGAEVTWTWSAAPVPEPTSAAMFAVAGAYLLRRRRAA